MNKQLEYIQEKVRTSMIQFEEIRTAIEEISETNIVESRVKNKLREFSSSILADMLICTDFLFELQGAFDVDEFCMIVDDFSGGGNE